MTYKLILDKWYAWRAKKFPSKEVAIVKATSDAAPGMNKDLLEEALHEAANQEESKRQTAADWLSNNRGFKREKLTAQWLKNRNRTKDKLITSAISALSTMEGVQVVNEMMINGLGITDDVIDQSLASTLLTKLYVIKFGNDALDMIGIPKEYRKGIMERVIARELPTKDNIAKDNPILHQLLSRELQQQNQRPAQAPKVLTPSAVKHVPNYVKNKQ